MKNDNDEFRLDVREYQESLGNPTLILIATHCLKTRLILREGEESSGFCESGYENENRKWKPQV